MRRASTAPYAVALTLVATLLAATAPPGNGQEASRLSVIAVTEPDSLAGFDGRTQDAQRTRLTIHQRWGGAADTLTVEETERVAQTGCRKGRRRPAEILASSGEDTPFFSINCL